MCCVHQFKGSGWAQKRYKALYVVSGWVLVSWEAECREECEGKVWWFTIGKEANQSIGETRVVVIGWHHPWLLCCSPAMSENEQPRSFNPQSKMSTPLRQCKSTVYTDRFIHTYLHTLTHILVHAYRLIIDLFRGACTLNCNSHPSNI